MSDEQEYGELVATVRQLSELITKLEIRLDSLITRGEYDYRVGKVEEDLVGLGKRMFHKTEENAKKIEAIQDIIGKIRNRATTGFEKIVNTERLLWAALAAAGWLASVIINNGLQ